MKKNLIYLGILLALVAVVYFALNRETSLFPKSEANFKVTNIEDVTAIFLSDPQGHSIRLSKQADDSWVINDSFKARADWTKLLLDGMAVQEAAQVVPASQHDMVIKKMAGAGIKVEVYKGAKKSNSFFVSPNPGPDNTTYMLNIQEDGSNAKRPYIVRDNGIGSTFLGVRYKTEMDHWRDKQIMYYPQQEIESIDVQFGYKPQYNFTLSTKPSLNISNGSDTMTAKMDKIRMKAYLDFYNKLYCLGFENSYLLKDTFLKTFIPAATIEMKAMGNRSHKLKIYYRQPHKGTNYYIEVNGIQYDGDTYFGWYDEKDFLLLSRTTVDKMLRTYPEFFIGGVQGVLSQ